jgi:uncharacterized protein (DUF305 family)
MTPLAHAQPVPPDRRSTPRRIGVLTIAAILGLAACGGDDGSTDTGPAATSDTGSDDAGASDTGDGVAEFSEADVFFAQHMIPHHEQAIEMSEIALDPAIGASDSVRALATEIEGAQDGEIDLMTQWLTSWGEPVEMDLTDDHSMESMQGMMTVEQMDALAATTGAAFDTLWLEMMIEHHRGAVAMAEDVVADGTNSDVAALAGEIITAQEAEIAEMEALLAG